MWISAFFTMSAKKAIWVSRKAVNSATVLGFVSAPSSARRFDTDGTRMKLESELSICIQSLQFHDRLIQQLAAVRNLLTGLSSHGPLCAAGFGARRWEELLNMLRDRLSADQHHQLFDLLMRTGEIDSEFGAPNARVEGSIELF